MLSRTLKIVVTVLIACATGQLAAQENLDAGKSPSQIFAGTCTACHRSARGLLKSVSPSSLQGFLRQHYTTGPEMAGVLAGYLMSNGAADTRYGDRQKGRDAKPVRSEVNPTARPEPAPAQGDAARATRRRLSRSTEPAGEVKPAAGSQQPQSTTEGRKSKRFGKRGKPPADDAPRSGDKTGETSGDPQEKQAEPSKEKATGAAVSAEPVGTTAATPESVASPPTRAEPSIAAPKTVESKTVEPKIIEPNAATAATAAEGVNAAEIPTRSVNSQSDKAVVNEALPPSLRRESPAAAAPVPSAPGASAVPPASVTASAPPPPAEPVDPPDPPISR